MFETLCRPSILANILAIYWLISPMNIAPVSLYIFLTETTATAEELHSSSRRAEAITCSYAGVQASTIRCQFWRAHEDLPSRIYRAGTGPGKSGYENTIELEDFPACHFWLEGTPICQHIDQGYPENMDCTTLNMNQNHERRWRSYRKCPRWSFSRVDRYLQIYTNLTSALFPNRKTM